MSHFSRRHFLTFAAVGLTGAALAACGSSAGTTAPPATSAASGAQSGQSAEVSYTDSGWSPNSVTVAVGGTVTFRNDSSGEMWVASNPHPVHTDYPGFDSLKALAKGETYNFKFEKAGTWGYHNHLKPTDTGEVVVK